MFGHSYGETVNLSTVTGIANLLSMSYNQNFPKKFDSDTYMQLQYEDTFEYQFSRVVAHMYIYVGSEVQHCAAAVTTSDIWISQGKWFDI